MKKLFFSITIALVSTCSLAVPVLAQTNCVNAGPYGICPPDTDIVIGESVITAPMLAGLIATYSVGVLLIATAAHLRKRTLRGSNFPKEA